MSTQQSHKITLKEFQLECGRVLQQAETRYFTWGTLNKQRNNVLVLFHALNCSPNAEEWWGPLIGADKPLDTNKYFVFSANALGGCFGSTGPSAIDPASGKRFGVDFPAITPRDMVRLQAKVLEHLGVQSVACVMGGGLGGMLALEWSIEVKHPRAVSMITLCSCGRQQPWQIGWSECQRQAIYADPHWQGGHYSAESSPSSGLSIARMMAMISYRAHSAYWNKFGRGVRSQDQSEFNVESYLHYQGKKFLSRGFDPASYVTLTQAMDSHDVSRGRGDYNEVLASVKIPSMVVSISSDVLYPSVEQEDLCSHMPNAQHHQIESDQGHDGFLLEHTKIGTLFRGFLLDREVEAHAHQVASKL